MATRRTKAKDYYIGFDMAGTMLFGGDVDGNDYIFSSPEAVLERYEEYTADSDGDGYLLIGKLVTGYELTKSIDEVGFEAIINKTEEE